MYGRESAKIYHVQHTARGKNYRDEADLVATHIHRRFPGASSVLDVACGTGGHLAPFSDLIGHTEGIDISEPMLDIARAELLEVPLHTGDMRDFDLGRTFDSVTCLFASIGYVGSEAELRRTLSCFARHVVPGGVVAVEPWWFPENYIDRWVSSDLIDHDGTTVARVVHTVRDGEASQARVHYLLASPEGGAHHFVEEHRAMLFTRKQYETAFQKAGLSVEYEPEVLSGRGLFVGVRR